MSDDEPHDENSEFDEREIGGEDGGNVETDVLPQLEQALAGHGAINGGG